MDWDRHISFLKRCVELSVASQKIGEYPVWCAIGRTEWRYIARAGEYRDNGVELHRTCGDNLDGGGL